MLDLMRKIEAQGEAEIQSHIDSPSAKALMHNIDFIGEEEDFRFTRTIDAEERHFHGELKTKAYEEGMRVMLRFILYELSKEQ